MTKPSDPPLTQDAGPQAPPLWLLSMLTAFGAMSIDIVLPGMPQMAADLGVPGDEIPFAIGSFLIGLGTGQIFWGWLGDWTGRRPGLLVGLIGYLLASLLCLAAQDGTFLFASRALQGVCAAAPVGLARAIVRDCFDGKAAAKALATIMLVFFLTPMLAPLVGAALLTVIDWRASFGFTAAMGGVGLGLVFWFLPETLAPAARKRRPFSALISVALRIIILRENRGAMLALIALSGGLFTYISLGPLVTQEVFGFSAGLYAALFTALAGVQMASSFLCQRLLKRLSVDQVFMAGCALSFCGGAVCAVSVWFFALSPAPLIIGLVIFMVGFGLVLPTATAKALSPFGAMAGLASAMLGAWQMFVSGGYSGLVGKAYNETSMALGLGLCGCGCVLLIAMALNVRGQPRSSSAHSS